MASRGKPPEEISGVLGPIFKKLAANRAFTAAFRCPRHEGKPLPCVADRASGAPGLKAPFGRVDCPIMEIEGCEPFRTYQGFLEGEREKVRLVEAGRCGLEGQLATARFETSEPTPAIRAVQDWLREGYPRGRALVLTGPTGVGKSWAAACAINATGGGRLFWLFSSLCALLMTPTRRDDATHQATRTPFVVFDEFGGEYLREGSMLDAMIDALIWTRENTLAPTIFTTNLDTNELSARLSPRAMDRLRGWATMLTIKGKSRRREGP